VLTPYCTARTPAITAAREPTAEMVKDRCMVSALDFEQQGARRTGEKMRNNEITAMSKGDIISICSRFRIPSVAPLLDTAPESGNLVQHSNPTGNTTYIKKQTYFFNTIFTENQEYYYYENIIKNKIYFIDKQRKYI
jgi:hypothetical protein